MGSPRRARAASSRRCRRFIATVAITYVDTAREAVDLCRYLGSQRLQLHGRLPTQEIPLIRAALPHLKIIRSVHVTGPEALAQARALERRVDALILDTYDAATGRHGATGKTHDWTISQQIVAGVRAPVMLAGGLTPTTSAQRSRRSAPEVSTYTPASKTPTARAITPSCAVSSIEPRRQA